MRIGELVEAAARRFPGLVPAAKDIAAEEGLRQSQKAGLEIDQGLFISAILRSKQSGPHLCQAMLLPKPESQALLPKFVKDGRIELPGASIERRGKAAMVTFRNPRFLNAEDQTTLDGMETCVDLALLDPAIEVAVLRGMAVEHPKYKDRHVFGAGINLTHLYHGRIPFLWYLERDLGYVNKLYRGLALPDDAPPDEFGGQTIEKPWIAAVESFAIGGHCQILLAVDYVLAENDAFMTLPARKEGIIPGAANMRLPRVGRRPHRPAGDPVRAAAGVRQPGGAADLRRDRAGRRHGCGDRARGDGAHQLRRGQRGVEPPRLPHHPGAAGDVPRSISRSMRASRPIATSARR